MRGQRISEDERAQAGRVMEAMDGAYVEVGRAERALLRAILECDRHDLWRGHGARDLTEFLAGRYGISRWKARRWIGAAYALEHLPLTEHALITGRLPLDKVVELTRFATPATEKKLISWARRVTSGGVRERADSETRASLQKTREEENLMAFTWAPFIDNCGVTFEGRMPTADASVVIAAIERLVSEMPAPVQDESSPLSAEAIRERRQADALVALCSARIANDQDPDRATVVVHAPLETMIEGRKAARISPGTTVPAATAQRLACDGRIEVVLHGDDDRVVGVGRASREPPHWLRRQVLRRDSHTCAFAGCEMKRFLRLHHMRWWEFGGPTDLDNLITLCHRHHKLVHEEGWSVMLDSGDNPVWFLPSGRRFEPGPAPPPDAPPEPEPSTEKHAWPAMWHHLLDDDYEVIKDGSTRRLLHYAARLLDRGKLPSDRFGDQAQDVVHHLFGGGAAHQTHADRPALSGG